MFSQGVQYLRRSRSRVDAHDSTTSLSGREQQLAQHALLEVERTLEPRGSIEPDFANVLRFWQQPPEFGNLAITLSHKLRV